MKYLEIAERLKSDIRNGIYPVGSRIPSIRELGRRYGANPQTVNKATAQLVSEGLLNTRQGSGSIVAGTVRSPRGGTIVMLADHSRSDILRDPTDPGSYHCKDIYLAFLLHSNESGVESRLAVYGRDDTAPREEVRGKLDGAAGVLVQGDLPDCYRSLLEELDIPYVLINRGTDGRERGRKGGIRFSDQGLSQVIEYILSTGHRRILFAFSKEMNESSILRQRYALFTGTLREWKCAEQIEEEFFPFSPHSRESSAALARLIDRGFTAALAYNDVSALGLYSLLHGIDRSIPGDFSVAGVDDLMVGQYANPPLTTVRIDRGAIVREALQLLDTLIHSKEPTEIEREFPTSVVIRKSILTPLKPQREYILHEQVHS